MPSPNEHSPRTPELHPADTSLYPVLQSVDRMAQVQQAAKPLVQVEALSRTHLQTLAGRVLGELNAHVRRTAADWGRRSKQTIQGVARRYGLAMKANEIRGLGGVVTVRQWQRYDRLKDRAEAEQSLAELEREGFGRWTWHQPTGRGRPTFRFELLDRDTNTGLCDTNTGDRDTKGDVRDAMPAAAESSHDGGAPSTDCMLAQAIVAISRMPLSPEERVDLVRQLSVTPAGGGQTVSSADGPLSPQATGEPSGRKGKRIPRDRAEQIIARHLMARPHDSVREVAEAAGCSVGLVSESWAWKANRARLRQARVEAKDPIAISLKDYLTKVGDSPASQRRAATDAQTDRDDKIDQRESELFALIGEVRQRKPDAPVQAVAKEVDCMARDVERYDSQLARLQAEQNADDG